MADKQYAKIDPELITKVGEDEVKRGLRRKMPKVKIDGRKSGSNNPEKN